MARELPQLRRSDKGFENQDAAQQFSEKIRAIIEEAQRLESLKATPKPAPAQPTGRTRLFRRWSCSESVSSSVFCTAC
jgi:hypothetical protein